MPHCIKVGNGSNRHEMPHRMKKEFCDQMIGPLYVKVVFTCVCIYIYIYINEYLKCVWKSNCNWIIQNDSKKKKKKNEE